MDTLGKADRGGDDPAHLGRGSAGTSASRGGRRAAGQIGSIELEFVVGPVCPLCTAARYGQPNRNHRRSAGQPDCQVRRIDDARGNDRASRNPIRSRQGASQSWGQQPRSATTGNSQYRFSALASGENGGLHRAGETSRKDNRHANQFAPVPSRQRKTARRRDCRTRFVGRTRSGEATRAFAF